jgi:hypothetical protein
MLGSGHPHPLQAPVLWPEHLGRSQLSAAPELCPCPPSKESPGRTSPPGVRSYCRRQPMRSLPAVKLVLRTRVRAAVTVVTNIPLSAKGVCWSTGPSSSLYRVSTTSDVRVEPRGSSRDASSLSRPATRRWGRGREERRCCTHAVSQSAVAQPSHPPHDEKSEKAPPLSRVHQVKGK